MKVTDKTNLDHMDGATKTTSAKRKGHATPSASSDKISSATSDLGSAKVKLSERAQDMKKIRAAVDSAPDVDEAKVAKFKNLIAKGEYKVDSKKVADKMVDEHAYNEFFNTN